MSYYLNNGYTDGERQAIEIASVQGWADFRQWVKSTPDELVQLHALVDTGTCDEPYALYDELHMAAQHKAPDDSAREVANQLLAYLPDAGQVAVSEEPVDDELDEVRTKADTLLPELFVVSPEDASEDIDVDWVLPAAHVLRCGGEGSGIPGPCPEGGAEQPSEGKDRPATNNEAHVPGKLASAFATVKDKAKRLVPAKVRAAASKFAAYQMDKYKAAFGEKGAKIILGAAGLVSLAPGGSAGFALVEAAYWAVRGVQVATGKAMDTNDNTDYASAVLDLLKAYYEELGEDRPEVSAEQVQQALADMQENH